MRLCRELIDRLRRKINPVIDIPSEPYRAAVMLIVADNGECNILFLERKEDPRDLWSGQMCLPGGRAKEEDANLLETAIRETLEETGVDIDPKFVVGVLEEVRPLNKPELIVTPFVAYIGGKRKVRINDEVKNAYWFSLSSLRRGEVNPKKFNLRGEVAYLVNGKIIWGMTARIVKNFLRLLDI